METNYIELLSDMRRAYSVDNVEWGNELARALLKRIDIENKSECSAIITIFKEATDKKQYDIAVDEIVKAGWGFDRQFEDGETLLHYAADKAIAHYKAYKNDERELFKKISMTGAGFNVQNKSGYNILTYLMTGCYRNSTVSEECLKEIAEYSDANVFSQKDNKGFSALHYALFIDCKSVLKIAGEKGCDLDVRADSGETPLHLAMALRNVESAKLLLDYGASPVLTGKNKRNVLHYFVLNTDVVERNLIKKGYWDILISKLSFDCFKEEILNVLEKYDLVNKEDAEGHVPFYYIKKKDDCAIAEWFLEKGSYDALPNIQREDIRKKFEDIAEEYDNFGRYMYMKMKLMEREGTDVSSLHTCDFWCESAINTLDNNNMFSESLFVESGYYIEQAIKTIEDIRFEEEKVFDIIRAALNYRLNHTEIFGKLRDMGVDLNKLQDDEGNSLLWKIVSTSYNWNNIEPYLYIPSLIENGVDIYERDEKEQSILWEFICKYTYELKDCMKISVLGKEEVEEKSGLVRLIEFFPPEEFTHKNIYGEMISLVAASAGKSEFMYALINKGIDINACGEGKFNGMTALHIACYRSYPQMVKMIIDAGADLYAVDSEGHSAAQYAAFAIYGFKNDSAEEINNRDSFSKYDDNNHNGDIEVLYSDRKKIWDMLPEIDIPDNNGVTPLLELSKSDKGVELCLDYMVGRGADINAFDRDGNTPVMVYIKHSRYDNELVRYIKSGADVNHQNNNGDAPLLFAMERKNFKLVKILISAGADVNTKNNEGITALDYAIEHEMTKFIQLLND